MRFHGLLGERKFSWTRRCCHRKLRRPEFPGADRLGVGAVTPLLGLVAARYSAHANGEAGVTTSRLRSVPGHQRKSGFGFAVIGSQRNGGLCRQQEESKRLLKVEADRFVVVT